MKTIRERLIELIESGNKNTLLRTLHRIQERFNAKAYLLLDLKESKKRQVFLIRDLDAKEDLLIMCDGIRKNEPEYVSEEPSVSSEVPQWYIADSSRDSVTYDMFCYMRCYLQKILKSGTIRPVYGFVLLNSMLLNKDEFIKGWSGIDITVCDDICFHGCLIDDAIETNIIDVQEIKKMILLPSNYYKLFSRVGKGAAESDEEGETKNDTRPDFDPEVSEESELESAPMTDSQQDSNYEISILALVGDDRDFYDNSLLEDRFDPPACKVYGPIPRPLDVLDKLVGLENVKSTIDNYSSLARYYARIAELKPDFKKPNMNKHALFLGNPGTAKTTVANVWASMLYENGMLSTGRTIVCSRETFIGRYYGDAERRWKQVIKLAKQGSLLYIDEAYLMAPPEDPKDSGHCIIQYLLKAIDECPDMCVVLAGYPDKIMNMMKINPGLLGRFCLQLEFADLDVTQLVEVTFMELERRGYETPERTKDKIRKVLDQMYAERDYCWSNARECHNLVEQAICKVASRVMACASPSIEALFTILPEDIVLPDKYNLSPKELPRKKIGFR